MCNSKPNIDTSTQDAMLEETRQARQREEERQARITDGTARIDETFRQFDDNFFDGVRQTYMDFYQPQVDSQFKDATDQLTFALARAGTLNSSIAADKQADLTTAYDDTLATLLSQATGEADSQRSRVAQEKNSLVSLLNQTSDADRVSNEALARTQQLFQERPTYNPIGDLFGGAAYGVGQYLQNRQNQALYDTYFGGGAGKSSAKVVGA